MWRWRSILTARNLGLWIEQTEGAQILRLQYTAYAYPPPESPLHSERCTPGSGIELKVVKLKSLGVKDIRIAVADRLKGFPEAIMSVFRRQRANLHRRSR